MKKNVIKVTVFLGILGVFFWGAQRMVMPKYYYPNTTVAEAASRIYRGFLDEEKDSIEAIFAGTSHMTYSVSPVELYEEYGFTSYNLASARQPLAVARYALQTALKTQDPKVFVLDVSSLFTDFYDGAGFKYVTEQVPLSAEKLQLLQEMSTLSDDEDDMVSGLFPMINYHSRWKELDENDFTYLKDSDHFFTKGYYLNVKEIPSYIDVDYMNNEAQEMIADNLKVTYTWEEQQLSTEKEDDELYEANVSDYNLQVLLDIADICEENGVKLLLVKIPVVDSPAMYMSSWTEKRSAVVKEIAEEYKLDYLDMVYDVDCGIEWLTDTADGGGHLNFLGAEKVTHILGQYLVENYKLEQQEYTAWDKDTKLYDDLKNVASLEMETDFYQYMSKLKSDFADKTVFIVCTNEMSNGLSEREISLLRSMGFNADYENGYRQSYIAVMENGEVTFEQMSNRAIKKKGTVGDSVEYVLYSAGHYVGSTSGIKIGGETFGTNQIGLNIVVYDQDKDIVLDEVNFNTFAEEHEAIRNSWDVDAEYLRQYEDYLINHVE